MDDKYEVPEEVEEGLQKVIGALAHRFGRVPSYEEVVGFLFGDKEERNHIWKYGLPYNKKDDKDASNG